MQIASLAGLLAILGTAAANVVQQVNVGEQAILPCPSSTDRDHRFQYWQVADDTVIGPGNPYNVHKYHYQVWSGNLIIKSVSMREAGLYKCISKHVENAGLNIQGVELVVNRDWEVSYEEDPQANTYRAVVAILVLLIVCMLAGFAYFARKQKTRTFTQLAREESPDEGPSTAGPRRAYNPTTTDKFSPPIRPSSRALDNAIVETDIKTSFSLTDYP